MKKLSIKYKNSNTEVFIENGSFHRGYLPEKNAVLICDSNIYKLYKTVLPGLPIIKIKAGEDSKTLATLEYIYRKLIETGADRSTFLIGIGGGIICDITGLAASTFYRGLRFGFVPTTLLAMADAAIGGKNGCNFMGYKNIIGTINQPEVVTIYTSFLNTLPKKEIRNGFSEIIKSSLIGSETLFKKLEKFDSLPRDYDTNSIEQLIFSVIKIKAGIVKKDELESGIRKLLNLGHTLGHAIESVYGLSHGEAVAIGCAFSGALSVKMKMLGQGQYERILNLFGKFLLPVNYDFDTDLIIDALLKDKKKTGNSIDFVLLDGIGKASIKPINIKTLKQILKRYLRAGL